MTSLTNCRNIFVIKLGNFVQSWTAAGSKIPQKYNPNAFFLQVKFVFYFVCIGKHRQLSVLIPVSPVSSTGIRDNNIICITPTMILYEDMKPIEHVSAWTRLNTFTWCAHANTVIVIAYKVNFILLNTLKFLMNLSLQTKKTDLTPFFTIKPTVDTQVG